MTMIMTMMIMMMMTMMMMTMIVCSSPSITVQVRGCVFVCECVTLWVCGLWNVDVCMCAGLLGVGVYGSVDV